MKRQNNRIAQIIQEMQPIMEERFRKSCKFFQEAVDNRANQIWDDVKKAVNRVLQEAAVLQKEDGKGELRYLCFSFMEYCSLLGRVEIRVDAFDSGFYLDEKEAAAEFILDFWQEQYLEDLHYLEREMEKTVIRVQNYERMEAGRVYMEYYNFAVFQMLQSMTGLVMEMVMESDADIADRFIVTVGKYMDKALILCEKRNKDEILFNGNG